MRKNSYLRPLFWQHGESKEILVREIEQMHQKGIGGFIVEARPHPDFLSYGWWRDLDIIIEAAKNRNMEVWIFDDSSYPSGIGAGKIKQMYPNYVKSFIAKHQIDIVGPHGQACVNVGAWIQESGAEGVHNLEGNEPEELICVLLAKRNNGLESIDVDSIKDITSDLKNGKIIVDIPKGNWRLFIITKTRTGGEEWTKDYVDPLCENAIKQYIDIIYEEHYKRYSNEFGKTIKGFFSDEPRFGNVAGYENIMWKPGVVYPYTNGLIEQLGQEYGKDFKKYLPFLWSNEDDICHEIHYYYMNTVTKLFADNFTGQIGKWCENHNVQFIGHLVEDNGAHARLGYGAGHFFRVMDGMHAAGMDLVYQVWPGFKTGRFTTPFGYLDAEFFYWGISKLTSSAAHIDPKKNGVALCEIFGAYGWQMGLKFMKWLTDHVCVRGINLLVPHAFSPKYMDADCPPHFYAGGNNPQWKYFHIWSEYANRICELLSNGVHRATAAVLYHAEAEWGGEYEPFEKVVKILSENQIACDVIPTDYLIDESKHNIDNKKLTIHKEHYEVLIIPYMQCISIKLLKTLINYVEQGFHVVFMSDYPKTVYEKDDEKLLDKLKESKVNVCEYGDIIQWMKDRHFYDILLDDSEEDLMFYHYSKMDQEIYFLTNENISKTCKTYITLPEKGSWIAYDAMNNKKYRLDSETNNTNKIYIELPPYQSIFLLKQEETDDLEELCYESTGHNIFVNDSWEIQIKKSEKETIKIESNLMNLSTMERFTDYSGDVYYTNRFESDVSRKTSRILLDLGEVYESCEVILNGVVVGCKIVPPYKFDITGLIKEKNTLEVKVTNTLVHEKGDNYFDRSMLHEPSGLLGPVKIIVDMEENHE